MPCANQLSKCHMCRTSISVRLEDGQDPPTEVTVLAVVDPAQAHTNGLSIDSVADVFNGHNGCYDNPGLCQSTAAVILSNQEPGTNGTLSLVANGYHSDDLFTLSSDSANNESENEKLSECPEASPRVTEHDKSPNRPSVTQHQNKTNTEPMDMHSGNL